MGPSGPSGGSRVLAVPSCTADGLPGTRRGRSCPAPSGCSRQLLPLGRREEGLRLFEQVLGLANDLLLLPEEIDPASDAYLGNYPR